MDGHTGAATLKPFRAEFAPPDEVIAQRLLAGARLSPEREARIDARAREMIGSIRGKNGRLGSGFGGIEEVLREYSLSTREGLALMVLAEALLRVPDGATADKLIEDKLGQGNFAEHEPKSSTVLVNASAWALGITARVIRPGETPEGILGSLAKRIGVPTVRAATRQAMRVMGSHFVLGQTIEEALKRATSGAGRLYRYSFDMLGEGARDAADAERYLKSYSDAIHAIGRAAGNHPLPNRPGISVKLSALHPRYDALSRQRVLDELVPKVIELAKSAKSYDLNFTVDAEEADRLELSLDCIAAIVADPELAGWDGFGLAIQAYQKRASQVIRWIVDLARTHDRKFMVRLVKGAYWDTEIKRTQERGLDDYPVFTRKAMTDMNYVACAAEMLAARPHLYPQFATHNALTVASIMEHAGDSEGYEFQRLHGMGDTLYAKLLEDNPGTACRTYAPVGGHRDLLAYLVRRLLENGANSSFVSVAADPNVPVETLLKRPADIIMSPAKARHAHIPLPGSLYGEERRNSSGIELGHEASLDALIASLDRHYPAETGSIIAGMEDRTGKLREIRNPANSALLFKARDADAATAVRAIDACQAFFPRWAATPVEARAAALDKAADLLEARRGQYYALMQDEGGKTIDDAIAELREAVDFLRYYASEARKAFGAPVVMPGPTGEDNRFSHRGRGVFICISPWNFPLAIFLGQVSAALVAGNTVVAKPAEQTPMIASLAVKLMHEAGIPREALALVTGDGAAGAALVAHRHVAGVAFTGSTEVARIINRTLAEKDGPITPLIAETGGINAMIVDATALPEQVSDDVVMSAFRSAGQRCSALRVLCVQEDVADKIIRMIAGAADELKIGDPRDVSTHIGPVIDEEARDTLNRHIADAKKSATLRYEGTAPRQGCFVAPHIFEVNDIRDVKREIFGPVLHVVRWKASELGKLIEGVNASGYGLTLGVHSRIETTINTITSSVSTGNIYVNRNMIGAVVGTQPFGGSGLSGTGPKAGGPHYLYRFANEQVITVNTAAAGGNAGLVGMSEE
ncbi:MAG: bifunctional proline dehydrogenase/L-glutamate gamma-semialdehyde dehydrogenase PutA [Beijerinckiaceae bacterium]|nr:bifunctional proline dehydrogenase/L-glutamate gamma-semialdehyde dehydrogenase PutA [Beijerinckiaceae bacterium]